MFNFLEKPFGLYITDEYIQAVQLAGNIKNLKIKTSIRKQLPAGIVVNGEVVDGKRLAGEINALPIKTKKCFLSIPEKQIYEHIFLFPPSLPEKDIIPNLEKLISETIPTPINELKYDYSALLMGNALVVFVTAIKQVVLAKYNEVLKEYCKLQPIIFEPEYLSLLRNIPKDFNVDRSFLLVDINGDKTSWYILWGGYVFDSGTVMQELGVATKEFHEKTNHTIDEILFSGDTSKMSLVQQGIVSIINTPVTIIDKYRVGTDQYKTACGLALNGVGVKLNCEINFLKKK